MGFIKYVILDFQKAMKLQSKILSCSGINFYYDITGHKNIKMFYLTGLSKEGNERYYLCLQEESGKVRYKTKKKVHYQRYITLPSKNSNCRYNSGPTALTIQEREDLKKRLKENRLCHPGIEMVKVNGEYKLRK